MTMDEATSRVLRQALYDRAHELCRCTNVRVYRKSWNKSEWSPYQRSVAAVIFRATLKDSERAETDTVHGTWVSELQVITATLNDVMAEMPEATAADPVLHGDRPAMKKEDFN